MRVRFFSALLPWAYIPLLWALCFSWPLYDDVTVTLPMAFLPAALWLGRKYGWQGVATIAIGGIGLSVSIEFRDWSVYSFPNLDLHIAALICSAIAAGLFPLDRCLEIIRTRPAAWLVMVLLPFHLGFAPFAVGSVAFRVQFDGYFLFWLALIAAGASQIKPAVLLVPAATIMAAFAAGLGQLLPWQFAAASPDASELVAPLSQLDQQLDHYVRSLASLLSMGGFFSLGRWIAGGIRARLVAPARWKSWSIVTFLAVCCAGAAPYDFLFRETGGEAPKWWAILQGDGAGVDLAAVLGGLLLGRAGIAWVAIIGSSLGLLLYTDVRFDILWPPISTAVVFGLIGIQLRRLLNPIEPKVPSLHLKYMVAISAALLALLPEEGWEGWPVVWLLFTVALVTAGIAFRIWVRRRATPVPALESEYEGWLALGALLSITLAVGTHFGEITDQLSSLTMQLDAGEMLDRLKDPGERVIALLAAAVQLAILWAILAGLKVSVEKLPALWIDVRRALGRLTRFFSLSQLATRLTPPEAEANQTPPQPHWAFRAWGYVNWTVLGAAIVLGVMAAIANSQNT